MEENSKKESEAFKALNKGKFLEAENLLKELVSGGSNNYAVYGSLAILIGKKGNIKEMLEYLKHSTKLNPKYAEGHFNLGIIYEELNETQKAIDCYERVINIDPL